MEGLNFSTLLIQDALERTFGVLRYLAGYDRAFGARSFRRILRINILGGGNTVPIPKQSRLEYFSVKHFHIRHPKLDSPIGPHYGEPSDFSIFDKMRSTESSKYGIL